MQLLGLRRFDVVFFSPRVVVLKMQIIKEARQSSIFAKLHH